MPNKIFHLESWAHSAGGYNIELYRKVHTQKESPVETCPRPFLFIGGVHGDEPEGVRLAEEFLKWLTLHDLEVSRPWILIPCLNVDGFRRQQRTNSRGVDLNRNFPTDHWKSSELKNRYYPGEHPASEPEVQALIQLVSEYQPEVIFHFHSWEPSLIYTGDPGKKWAEILTLGNDYPVKHDIGYPTPGSLGEWGWEKMKTPVICVEEQEKIDLDLVWDHFKRGLQKIVTELI